VFTAFADTTPEQFESAWRINAMGLFLCAQEVVPAMQRSGAGAVVVTGATASRKGGARATPFSSAKGAQRLLAESMARSLGPQGIHVALIVVDGVVDLPRTRERMPGKPDTFFVRPDGVADIALSLVRQDRQAWSFEVEARPFAEVW
jgi:NAD(P)-dependent dehydrogenase (short-subunit alcohol dehydrogenase family)